MQRRSNSGQAFPLEHFNGQICWTTSAINFSCRPWGDEPERFSDTSIFHTISDYQKHFLIWSHKWNNCIIQKTRFMVLSMAEQNFSHPSLKIIKATAYYYNNNYNTCCNIRLFWIICIIIYFCRFYFNLKIVFCQ